MQGRTAGASWCLVECMSAGEVTLQLVNLDPVEEKVVVVQGGAYAEHQIARVRSTPVPGASAESSEAMLLVGPSTDPPASARQRHRLKRRWITRISPYV